MRRAREERGGTDETHEMRATLSCEDGLPARDRRSTPLGYENFQGNSAGEVGQLGCRFGGFGPLGLKAESDGAALHFDSECSELRTQNGRDYCVRMSTQPHFLTACVQNSTFELREITAPRCERRLTLAQKIQFLVGPKIIRITAYFS